MSLVLIVAVVDFWSWIADDAWRKKGHCCALSNSTVLQST